MPASRLGFTGYCGIGLSVALAFAGCSTATQTAEAPTLRTVSLSAGSVYTRPVTTTPSAALSRTAATTPSATLSRPLSEGTPRTMDAPHAPLPEEEEWNARSVSQPESVEQDLAFAVSSLPFEYEPGLWPVTQNGREVLSDFGRRSSGLHQGIDIRGPFGTPVLATAQGVVSFSGSMSGYGNVVIIQHENGVETRYGHLNTTSVPKGAMVRRGDKVGTLGASGNASTPHVHYEVRYQKKPLDPFMYLPAE